MLANNSEIENSQNKSHTKMSGFTEYTTLGIFNCAKFMGQITPVFLVYIPKHRLWVHVRSVSQSMFGVKIRIETFSFLFLLKLFSFYKLVGIKTKVYRHVFVIILIFFFLFLFNPTV